MPTIIFINGTSSSGKTSLLKLLQKKLPEPYLDMGIDKFIWMLPSRYLDRPLWDEVLGKALHSGPVGLTLFSGMHHAIAAASEHPGRGREVFHEIAEFEQAHESIQPELGGTELFIGWVYLPG